MPDEELSHVKQFDVSFTTKHLQMLKILSFYLPKPFQYKLAAYIKLQEFQYIRNLLSPFSRTPLSKTPGKEPDPTKLWEELLPFCEEEEKKKIKQMKDIYQQFETIQGVMEMANAMGELFPEGSEIPMDFFSQFSDFPFTK